MTSLRSFYKSKTWKNKREAILRRDEYLCQECKRYGRTRQANTVHHIFPLETYPEYRLTNNNLYSVCRDCHESFHDRANNGALTEAGLQLKERMAHLIIPCNQNKNTSFK